ncbi:MAG TPA: hypothetical protein DEB31_02270 [Clostridiales bacterium]|nr:hypothetical protein [Clostridiales bacterium]
MANEVVTVGLPTMGLGLLVTFVALILIIVIVYILSVVTREKKKNAAAEEVIERSIAKPAAEAQAAMIEAKPVQAGGDETLAVITAALAAYMAAQGGSMNGLVVKSYRRANAVSPWARAGRSAQINNKF